MGGAGSRGGVGGAGVRGPGGGQSPLSSRAEGVDRVGPGTRAGRRGGDGHPGGDLTTRRMCPRDRPVTLSRDCGPQTPAHPQDTGHPSVPSLHTVLRPQDSWIHVPLLSRSVRLSDAPWLRCG